MQLTKTERIRQLNDAARETLDGCRVLLTQALQARPDLLDILEQVRTYDAFTADNDPFGEHDFGSFQLNGETVFWKFDYFDLDLTMGSLDPSEPSITARVLTIMFAEEY